MRKTFVLTLPLLAGCALAQPEPPRPQPVIARIVASDGATNTAQLKAEPVRLVDAACQTGDRMPTARLQQPGERTSMPNMQPLRPLPFIPNLCPVIAAPAEKPAVLVGHLRGPERVPPPAEP